MSVQASCIMCGKPAVFPYHGRVKLYQETGRAYCSRPCVSAYQSKVSSETMARTNRQYASERMTNRNPMRRADVRARVSDTLRSINHKPPVQGGNGKEPPKAEQALMRMLEPFGFVHQHPISTGLKREHGYPTCYKPDAAHPQLKIAVEADGRSHKALARRAQDVKKDTFLQCNGWTVLRFTNREILEEPMTVMFTILKLMNSTPTSQME